MSAFVKVDVAPNYCHRFFGAVKHSGSTANRYSLKLDPDLSVRAPSDLANAYGSCLFNCQLEPIRKRRRGWEFKASTKRGNIPDKTIARVRVSRRNFGDHSHGSARNSSSLLHHLTVRLTYFQTENGCRQKTLMMELVVVSAPGPGILSPVDSGV